MSSHSIVGSTKPTPVSTVASFYELSSTLVNGKMEVFSKYEGRVILVVNIASADTNCSRELKKVIRVYVLNTTW